jgi:hypothetical protein
MNRGLAVAAGALACAAGLLAATPALKADAAAQQPVGCRRTDRPPPRVPGDTTVLPFVEDIRRDPTFLCTLRRGGPTARVVFAGDHGNWPEGVRIHVPPASARPSQVLSMEDAQGAPPLGSDFVLGQDLDRDGWMDLKVMSIWGVKNRGYDVYMYRPVRGRFVRDTVLSGQGLIDPIAGRPCVTTYWSWGGADFDSSQFCWVRGRWSRVVSVSERLDARRSNRGSIFMIRETRDYRGAGRARVRVDTIRDN